MAFSEYFAEQILGWVKGDAFVAPPANYIKITLHSSDPGSDGLSNDETTNICNQAYVSYNLALNAVTQFNGPTASGDGWEITNKAIISMAQTANNATSITITHFGIWAEDSNNVTKFIASGSLTTSVEIQSGDTVQFNADAMAIKVV